MENRKDDLGDNMLWGNQIDVVHIANILQFDIPLTKLFGRQILTIPLMSNIVILTKDTPKIAAREEDCTGSCSFVSIHTHHRLWNPANTIVALYTRLLIRVSTARSDLL